MKPDRQGLLLKVSEASVLAHVNTAVLRRWIRQGREPAYGHRGTYRVLLEDIMPKMEPVRKVPKTAKK